MEFVRQMWGKLGFTLPGMVTPTFSQPDLEKNIADLKAVEGWLRTNLSMLQMTIQGLEMQKTTLSTVEAVGKIMRQPEEQNADASGGDARASIGETLQRATLWPYSMMQQVQEGLQKHLEGEVKAAADRANAAADRAKAAAATAAAVAPKKRAAAKPKAAPKKPVKKPES
jgi:hypothetical protein